MGDLDPAALVAGIRDRDRRALARAITLVESTRADHRRAADAVLEAVLRDSGGSLRVGVSGPPGVGKSSTIEVLGTRLCRAGTSVAVLAVDPSSSVSGGSILGDKTRMEQLNREPNAFIRPSPGGGHLGGVARRTREALLLCEAFGFDVVLVETIGVGQSEVAVADLVDVFVLLVSPGGGDELQGIKRGIMELADVVAVTKADGDLAPAAGRTRADHANALGLLRPRWPTWRPEALAVSAHTGEGIDDLWDALTRFRSVCTADGSLSRHRADQAAGWFWAEVRDTLVARVTTAPELAGRAESLEAEVRAGRTSPGVAARALVGLSPDVEEQP